MNTIRMASVFRGGIGFLVCATCALAITGCSLPAITAEFPVAEDQALPGTLISVPLSGWPLIPGVSCNLPDEEDFNQVVADSLGSFLSRFVVVESAELETMTLEVAAESPGDFSRITNVALNLYLLDVGGIRLDTVALGNANNPGGFGDAMQLTVDPAVDLVALVSAAADCGAISISVGGFTSSQDVVFDVRVRLKIRARIQL